jgi:hypothetical protein
VETKREQKPSDCVDKEPRRKPGPAPDPAWPEVMAKVTKDCMAAGYRKPLKRGQLAAVGTMLLSEMAGRDKHFSEDTARTYAKQIIASLPDKSD